MSKDIIDEVQEDLKQEKEAFFTTKIVKIFSVISVILVIGVSIFSWKEKTVSELQFHMSNWFNKAFLSLESNNKTEALKYFNKVIEYPHQDLASLAYLNKSALHMKENKIDEAEKTLLEMMNNPNYDQALLDLAQLQFLSMQYIKNVELTQEIETKLELLCKQDQPWQFSALILKSLFYIKSGKQEDAKNLLKQVISNPRASKSNIEIASNINAAISR